MRDFVDTKPFGATCTGLAAGATCYVAGSSDWLLIASPLVVMCAYYLFFFAPPRGRAPAAMKLAGRKIGRRLLR